MQANETTYQAMFWGQRYCVRADWSDLTSPIWVRLDDDPWLNDPYGRQVADVSRFNHPWEAAMGDWLGVGEDDDDKTLAVIAKAVDSMTELA